MLRKFKNLGLENQFSLIVPLVLYTIFIAVLEIVALGSIFPFIAIVNDTNVIQDTEYFSEFSYLIEDLKNIHIVNMIGSLVLFLFLLRAIIGIHYKYVISKFSYEIYYQISKNLYVAYLNMPYIEFTKKNTDDMRKAIIHESNFFSSLVSSILLIFSELLVFLAILVLMFVTDKIATLIILIVSISVYILSKSYIAPNISIQGKVRAKSQSDLFRLLGQTFGNFKLNKTSNKQQTLTKGISNILRIYTKAQVNFLTLSDVPRYIIETLGFGLIVVMVLYLYSSNNGDVSTFIPVLTVFAVSLFRILPSYNRIVTSVNNIHFFSSALNIVTNELAVKQEILDSDKFTFKHTIECKNITFSHGSHLVLKDISLKINKGEKVAIVGESGSGKTTLVDIIMGLTSPDSGSVYIDKIKLNDQNKKFWRGQMGYIPQDIYLMDGTVKENVLFDRKYSDFDVGKALKLANLFDVMQSKNGLKTKVGDAGVQLSGGQKQRVGIARAILSNPEVLVFDEGTAALDDSTEKEILNDLLNNNKDKTIVFITHKKSLISMFDKVISL